MSAIENTTCGKCHNGWIRETRDGVEGMARCECWKRRIAAAKTFDDQNPDWPVPPILRGATFATFKTKPGDDSIREAWDGANMYAGAIAEDRSQGGILFTGPVGTGKSHLAAAILYKANRRGLFVNVPTFLDRLRHSYDAENKAHSYDLTEPLFKAPVLVLDDLGAERTSDWVEETLYLVVNERQMNRLPTVVTTNKSIREGEFRGAGLLIDQIGERTFDRILGMCWDNSLGRLNVFEMRGHSRRWGR